jgi:hypothetical protein
MTYRIDQIIISIVCLTIYTIVACILKNPFTILWHIPILFTSVLSLLQQLVQLTFIQRLSYACTIVFHFLYPQLLLSEYAMQLNIVNIWYIVTILCYCRDFYTRCTPTRASIILITIVNIIILFIC